MLTVNFARTTIRKFFKCCQGTFLIVIFLKTEKEEQKKELRSLIVVIMGLYISFCKRISCLYLYSDQYEL